MKIYCLIIYFKSWWWYYQFLNKLHCLMAWDGFLVYNNKCHILMLLMVISKNLFSYLLVNNKNRKKKFFSPAYFDKNANTHGRANIKTFFFYFLLIKHSKKKKKTLSKKNFRFSSLFELHNIHKDRKIHKVCGRKKEWEWK